MEKTKIRHKPLSPYFAEKMGALPSGGNDKEFGEMSSPERRKTAYESALLVFSDILFKLLPGDKPEDVKKAVAKYIMKLIPVPYFFGLACSRGRSKEEKVALIQKLAQEYDPRCYQAAISLLELPALCDS